MGRSSRRHSTASRPTLHKLTRACRPTSPHLSIELLEPRTLLATGPAGPEFAVTAPSGNAYQYNSAIDMDSQGNFVIAWLQNTLEPTTNAMSHSVMAQRFDALGQPQGNALQIYTAAGYRNQFTPAIDMLAIDMDDQGSFIVVWDAFTDNDSGNDIYARSYDAATGTLDNAFRVNTTTTGSQTSPDVAMGPGGNYTIVWHSEYSQGIYARQFNSDGSPTGSELRITSNGFRRSSNPEVAVSQTGSFVVAWTQDDMHPYGGSLAPCNNIYVRQYDSTGQPQGDALAANADTGYYRSLGSVAMADGGSFVVTWSGYGLTDADGIFARRYTAQGNWAGDEFRVNTRTQDFQGSANIAMHSGTGFVITWTSPEQDGGGTGIYAQRYDATGTPQGNEFQVNASTRDNQLNSAAAIDAKGNFVVTWTTHQPTAESHIYAQRFATSDTPASIVGRFWIDSNANNLQDPNEVGYEGVPVQLCTASGLPVASTLTGPDGTYHFTDILPDERYYIQVTLPKGDTFVAANIGTDDSRDSDVNTKTGRTPLFTPAPGDSNPALDVGVIPQTRISGVVFDDFNADGIRNADEQALPGWLVFLDANNNGRPDKGELSTTTASNGTYTFQGVPFGSYAVTLTPHDLWTLARPQKVSISRGQIINHLDLPNQSTAPGLMYTPLSDVFHVSPTDASFVEESAIGIDAAGNFVIAWPQGGPNGRDIYAQRYNAAGLPQGAPFRVNRTTQGDQMYPDLAMDPRGNFVVVWQDRGTIRGQRFDASGTPLEKEFAIGPTPSRPSIAMDAQGNFAIAYARNGLAIQRYSAAGAPLGAPVRAVGGLQDGPLSPDIAMNARGEFVVAWESDLPSGAGMSVYAQRYDSAAHPIGETLDVAISTSAKLEERLPSVAIDAAGNFIVGWQRIVYKRAGDDASAKFYAYARRYNAKGVPQTEPLRLDSSLSLEFSPRVTMAPDGTFVATWYLQGGIVQGQVYNAAGVPQGDVFNLVGDPRKYVCIEPRIAISPKGDLVATWIGESTDTGQQSIDARRFKVIQKDMVVAGSAKSDQFYLTRVGNAAMVYAGTNAAGRPIANLPLNRVKTLAINGLGRNDALYVDFSNGNPIPVRGIYFNGGVGDDSLLITGTRSTDRLQNKRGRIYFGTSLISPSSAENFARQNLPEDPAAQPAAPLSLLPTPAAPNAPASAHSITTQLTPTNPSTPVYGPSPAPNQLFA